MGYRHDRDDMVDAAVQVALDDGLGALTFRAVGRRLELADRTVVYYFPTKDDLVSAVLDRMTAELMALLATTGDEPVEFATLVRRGWGALSDPGAGPVLRVYLESVGLAAQGREPYRRIAEGLATTWTSWATERLSGDASTRGDRAHAVVATLDGLLLLRVVAGEAAAAAAARGLGLDATT